MRTIIISYMITASICLAVILALWLQNRRRLAGLSMFAVSYIFQFGGLLLMALRDLVPDFLSILLGNAALMLGNILLIIALHLFFDRPVWKGHTVAVSILFLVIFYYFTFISPNLQIRIIFFSLFQAAVFAMGIWLIARQTAPQDRPEGRDVLLVLGMQLLLIGARVVVNLVFPPASQQFFASGTADSVLILSTEMLFIATTFALVMMVNRRLHRQMEASLATRIEAENGLAQKNLLQERLGRLGHDLAAARSLEEIFSVAEGSLREMIDCPNIAITLFDSQTATLAPAFISADGERIDPNLAPPLVIDPASAVSGRGLAVTSQRAVVQHDLARLSREGGAVVLGDQRLPDSAVYLPMVVEGETVGLLELQSYRSAYYTPQDCEWLAVAANQIGLGIQNARLLARLQRTVEELRQSQGEVERLNATLEQRVRDRTAELQAANKELESFASAVSHDLRAPLRAMAGFADALASDYRERMDEQGLHYLERIQANAERMSQLIEDLLKLSRVSRQELNRQDLDFCRLAAEALEEVRAAYPGRDVQVSLPIKHCAVNGDPLLLKVVLTNLLDNAWKYTAPRPQAHVWLECRLDKKSGQRVFCVRDNGVGFDMSKAGNLFAPFQRLHSTREFPGNGIGLATVQRIIQRHGGNIWVEAAVDQGAAFYFTLGESR